MNAARTYPDMQPFLDLITQDLQQLLGSNLIGLYLTGSLAAGSYQPGLSDIDLIGVVERPVTQPELAGLAAWGQQLLAKQPLAQHLDIAITDKAKIQSSDGSRSRGGIEFWKGKVRKSATSLADSPLIWDCILQTGRTLYGTAPWAIVPAVPTQYILNSFEKELQELKQMMSRHFKDDLKFRYYVITTLCRMHFTLKQKSYASKPEALAWYAHEYGRYPGLVKAAQAYRAGSDRPILDTSANDYAAFIGETEKAVSLLRERRQG